MSHKARNRKKAHHKAKFARKVEALQRKGFTYEEAKNVAGAMIVHAAGKLTKAEKAARKIALKAAHKIHDAIRGL